MKNVFNKFKTFDQIVAPLAQIQQELLGLVARNNAVVESNLQMIDRLRQRNEEAQKENRQSEAVIQKIDGFLGNE